MTKNLIFALSTLTVIFSSCSKKDVLPSSSQGATNTVSNTATAALDGSSGDSTKVAISQSTVPTTITNYLTTNYPGYVFGNAFTEMSGTAIKEYYVNFTYNGLALS